MTSFKPSLVSLMGDIHPDHKFSELSLSVIDECLVWIFNVICDFLVEDSQIELSLNEATSAGASVEMSKVTSVLDASTLERAVQFLIPTLASFICREMLKAVSGFRSIESCDKSDLSLDSTRKLTRLALSLERFLNLSHF